MPKKNIAIVGATGYTGSELVRILNNHPEVNIQCITSESRAGEAFSDVHPSFLNLMDQPLISVDQLDQYEPDLAFLALPHGVSMDYVKKFESRKFKIVDLSGDFRLDSPKTYNNWYPREHNYHKGFERAVYGIPELNRAQIKDSVLTANPGCYPTSAILALHPLISEGLIEPGQIIVDAKSGTTGAGVKARPGSHFSNVNDNFKAYGIATHRHTIEIQTILAAHHKQELMVQFTPHLLPVDRGILSTLYLKPKANIDQKVLNEVYRNYYDKEAFIRLRKSPPAIKEVRGTNFCDIHPVYDQRTGMIIVVSVIDNLVKGAAGQAVQNMNLMLDLEEGAGLNQIPMYP